MAGKWLKIAAFLSAALMTGGCWDMHDIEDVNYVNAIGIDYSEESRKFTIYAQLLDFSSVAKQETGPSKGPAITYVGKGQGSTLNLAINDLYATSQQRMFWAHVASILVSDAALRHGIGDFSDGMKRYREVRFTPLVYGAHESMENLLSMTGFFNLSPINTIENTVRENYRQKSMIAPMQWLRFLADRLEPGKTIVLPTLKVNDKQWHKKGKPERKPEIDGAYVLHGDEWKGWFSIQDLHGLRWVQKDSVRTPLEVRQGDKVIAVLSLDRPKASVKVSFEQGKPYYRIKIKVDGNVVEQYGNHNETRLLRLAEEVLESEVTRTFERTVEANADVYQLEYVTYRHDYRRWKKWRNSGGEFARPDALREVTADIRIEHHGMQNTYHIQ